MVLFLSSVVLTFESLDEILSCYHFSETSLVENWHGVILFSGFYKRNLEFLGIYFHWKLIGMKG